jgi:hypothetical protein
MNQLWKFPEQRTGRGGSRVPQDAAGQRRHAKQLPAFLFEWARRRRP